ncbi:class I SAM-dependent methyltransferase, partial [Frankia gtarii]|uniref:class I SAM-dependent methyltransferase n=1 Tax=Frankia gtarii TaxID=2950102 RepID=UPI0021C1BCE5
LAVGTRLRAAGVPVGLVAAAFTQAELRRRAAAKFARAEEMFFTRAGLEQASSQAAAEHRAARFAGLRRLADLCTGIGGDALALAPGREILLVDRDPAHLRMAALNVAVHGAHRVDTLLADVRDVDLTGYDGVFVDPARRTGDRRLASRASEPPLPWCFALADRVAAVAVKAAPGLATDQVPSGWEIEFVADGRDLKEAVLFSPALATAERRATVLHPAPLSSSALPGGRPVSLVGIPDPAEPGGPVADPGQYLYDPSPAVTRAGLVGELARRLGAWQVDPMIAFLSSDEPVASPFARLLRISASLPFDVRRLVGELRGRGIGSLEIRRRGLAGDVDELRRRLLPRRRDLVAGGPAITLVMTRMRDEPWAFLCTPVEHDSR